MKQFICNLPMISFDLSKPLHITLVGRVAIDFNPTDYNRPLDESSNFNKYLGGSPANIAVGMARLGNRVGFLGRVSDDQFGTYVTKYFQNEGIDVSHIRRCEHGEKLGLTFTEMLSPTESSILMYREGVADLQLSPEDVDEEYIRNSACLLISGTALCTSPTREACFKALTFAKRNGVPVVFAHPRPLLGTHPQTPPVREGSCSYSEHSNLPSRTGGVWGWV